jgi:hypothetical protein
MPPSVESEARKALNRLRRAVEKARRELDDVRGALAHVEGNEFPADAFTAAADRLGALEAFVDEQAERLEEKILHAGGLEPGRIRRG